VFFLNVCSVLVFYMFLCCSVYLFLYGPFFHHALKLDMSTLFTTFFLSKAFQFILFNILNNAQCAFNVIQKDIVGFHTASSNDVELAVVDRWWLFFPGCLIKPNMILSTPADVLLCLSHWSVHWSY